MPYAALGWRHYGHTTIERFIREGRGSGQGAAYRPWLTVRDVSSLGLSSRDTGWKTQRVHHFLSKLELHYFYCLEWSHCVVDIREQYPLLPLEETLAIAQQLGIEHPRHPASKEPVVMTTDFLIVRAHQSRSVTEARTVKQVTELTSERTLAKFEIERRYWEQHNVDWGIVTEREIPQTLAMNVELLHEPRYLPTYTALPAVTLADTAAVLTDAVSQAHKPLREITAHSDRRLGFAPGTCLKLAYFLIATRQWRIDMSVPINPDDPIVVQAAALDPLAVERMQKQNRRRVP